MDDLNKCILQSFFEGIPTIASDYVAVISKEEDVTDLNDEIDSAVQEIDVNQVLVMKRINSEETEDAPQKKKPKPEQNGHGNESRPIRNLRSRARNPPIKDYNPLDFASDEEEIPEILRVPSETTISKPPSRFDRFEHFENTIHLLTYRDIPIQMEDYKCLDRRELVSNFVLDFYLQYLYHEVLPEEMRSRIHIYKTHFYTLLATKANFAGWKEGTKGAKAAEKRYERVKDLDNEVNIFERDFVVFPCNTNEHWFLAIACFARLNGAIYTESKERIEDDEERNRDLKNPSEGKAIRASCVLILDSVSTNPGRKTAAMTHIKNFLMSEYQAKYSHEFALEASNIRTGAPKVTSKILGKNRFLYNFVDFSVHCKPTQLTADYSSLSSLNSSS